jgi:hypothetical protein
MSNEKGKIKQWDKKADRIGTYEIKEVTIDVAKVISRLFDIGLEEIEIFYSDNLRAYFFRIGAGCTTGVAGLGDCLVRGIAHHRQISVHKCSDIERDFTEVTE